MDKEKIIVELVKKLSEKEPNSRTPTIIEGDGYIAYVNYLRKFSGLIQTLQEELHNTTTMQLWLDVSGQSNSGGCITTTLRLFEYPPVIANSCIHVLLVMSDISNEIEYSKFILNRYMNMYTTVIPVDPRKRPKKKPSNSASRKKVVKKGSEKPENFFKQVLSRFLKNLLSLL